LKETVSWGEDNDDEEDEEAEVKCVLRPPEMLLK
jgi:hypothetical protein